MIDVKCTVCDATDGDVEITVRLVQGKDQIVVRPIGKDRTEHREFVGVLSLELSNLALVFEVFRGDVLLLCL